jgi:hypothetical protein
MLHVLRLVKLALAIALLTASESALATIDTFTADHVSGSCSSARFDSKHFAWAGRDRVLIAAGETIAIRLYGHGADFAQDATGSRIHEWISSRGTTTNYPNAPIVLGGKVPKGYVVVKVQATSLDGTGNRTVTVKWLTGNEHLSLKIVANCAQLSADSYRARTTGSGGGTPPSGSNPPTTSVPSTPNLLPSLGTPVVLTRPLASVPQVIPTPSGGMNRIDGALCGSLADSVISAVAVPKLTWGVSGVNITAASSQFNVQLLDVADSNAPRVLDTLILPQGFPANTPLMQKNNYPGRLTSIRVVKNPRFKVGSEFQTFVGCFTEPGKTQALDAAAMLIKVDAGNSINEGNRENDNELRF